MGNHDVIVLGASAGGVEALTRLCGGLPAGLPASLFVVQHVAPAARSVLPELLARAGPLPAGHPVDGEAVRRGHIYVAPPNLHMLLLDGRIRLRRGPHENRTRPAADVLFRSAAAAHGGRVVGVVLTGLLDDGTAGLIAVKRCGGVSVVQDPDDAEWPGMPRNALMRDSVDHSVPLRGLAPLLVRLASEPRPDLPFPRRRRWRRRSAFPKERAFPWPSTASPSALRARWAARTAAASSTRYLKTRRCGSGAKSATPTARRAWRRRRWKGWSRRW